MGAECCGASAKRTACWRPTRDVMVLYCNCFIVVGVVCYEYLDVKQLLG